MTRLAARLRRDRRGATIVEFALVAPVMLATIIGLSDLAYQFYVQAVLSGAMQQAGRNSTIQGNDTDSAGRDIDEMVKARVREVIKPTSFASSRKSYAQFGNVAAEPFEDNNNNKVYDKATECFTDVNGNRKWDEDPGVSGQGGASDVVVYRMDVTYTRLMPAPKLVGLASTVTASATTILKNQPYRNQISSTPEKICPA